MPSDFFFYDFAMCSCLSRHFWVVILCTVWLISCLSLSLYVQTSSMFQNVFCDVSCLRSFSDLLAWHATFRFQEFLKIQLEGYSAEQADCGSMMSLRTFSVILLTRRGFWTTLTWTMQQQEKQNADTSCIHFGQVI